MVPLGHCGSSTLGECQRDAIFNSRPYSSRGCAEWNSPEAILNAHVQPFSAGVSALLFHAAKRGSESIESIRSS